jgi:hypothetical protein
MVFGLCDDDQDFASECTKELPDHPAVIPAAWRHLQNRSWFVDRCERLFKREIAFFCALFEVGGIVNRVRHQ